MAVPKLVIFDLDATLWPGWLNLPENPPRDTRLNPPFRMDSNGNIYDSINREVKPFEDVPQILCKLHKEGYQIAIASRTEVPQGANDLIRLFQWDEFIHYRKIFPGVKITHFKELHNESGIPYKDMIFYDDEQRNITDVSSLGVTCILVPDGVSGQSFQRGFQLFASRNSQ